ncbi:hypothetical protein FSP39_013720 [Pinctada imbricata]|uniref:Alpha-type protein kinase domain-containing protein n=1 Tax=Pinctada imbricata TaxID=66713 RepID=A0AA89BKN7_PINIB|nr:hypothetical protein FSP39_013720 [Pinctada imbricata]
MNVCKCENLSLWGALDVIHSTAPFPYENGYVKFVQFDFEPKLKTKRFLIFCGSLLPVGADDGANRDVIVKCRRERPASDEYWTLYFTRMDIGRHVLSKFDDETEGKRGDYEIDFTDVSEAKFEGYSYWDEIVLTMKEYFHRKLVEGEHVIVEEYLPGKFEKFDKTVDDFVQSFQHFSYHMSEREFIFFGLEGVKFDDFYKLTVPFIHSVKKEFGPRDKGEDGITDFFINHRCNDICRKWTTPKKIRRKTKVAVDGNSDMPNVSERADGGSVELGDTGVKFDKSPAGEVVESRDNESSDEDSDNSSVSKVKLEEEYVNLNSKREESDTAASTNDLHADDASLKGSDNGALRKNRRKRQQSTENDVKSGDYKAIHPDPPVAKTETHSSCLNATKTETNSSSLNATPKMNGSCPRDEDAKKNGEVFYISDIPLDLNKSAIDQGSRQLHKTNGIIGARPQYLNNNDPKQQELNKSQRKLTNNEIVIHCDYLGERYFGSNGFRSTCIIVKCFHLYVWLIEN